jgi:anti-sigma factor RsiW
MDCSGAESALTGLIDGSLARAEAAEAAAHLSGCASCRARRRTLEAAREAFAAAPREAAPAGFAARLGRRLDAERAERPSSARRLFPALAWAPALAAAAGLAVLAVRARRPRAFDGAPRVERSGEPAGYDSGRLGREAGESPCASAADCS